MEDACRIDYKKIYGKYPQWNFQENGEEWPAHIQKLYTEQVNQRKKKDNITQEESNSNFNSMEAIEPNEGVVETWL
jgi:hypothetical protein